MVAKLGKAGKTKKLAFIIAAIVTVVTVLTGIAFYMYLKYMTAKKKSEDEAEYALYVDNEAKSVCHELHPSSESTSMDEDHLFVDAAPQVRLRRDQVGAESSSSDSSSGSDSSDSTAYVQSV